MAFLPIPEQQKRTGPRRHRLHATVSQATADALASAVPPAALGSGPGFEFAKLVGLPGCDPCVKTMQRMNELGPDGCRRERESILAELRENKKMLGYIDAIRVAATAVKDGWAMQVDWRDPLPGMLDVAIRRAAAKSSAADPDRPRPEPS